MTKLALDRATVRRVDEDGRLYVEVTNISKANVCPYLGSEIPDADKLGLKSDQIYQLLRDPEELAKAASTFNNIPLLSEHVPVSAEDHRPDLVVGSTGTDAEFKAPYLRNSLVVWSADAIAGVESDDQRELSCAYRYVADMTPGTYQGTPYDGVMRELRGNHVALVAAGRAGPDVVVGDSQLETPPMKKKAPSREVKLAKDAFLADLKSKLANDADLDGLAKLLDALAPEEELGADEDDTADPETAQDGEGLSEEEEAQYQALAKRRNPDTAQDEDEPKKGDDKKDDKAAMDAALKSVESTTIARMNAIREAEKAVRPHIGELAVAMDSAEAVYKLALDAAKVNLTGVPTAAYAAMVRMLPIPGGAPKAVVAMDSSVQAEVANFLKKGS